MAYQQQIDVLMESKQPDQDNNDDTKNCRSSIRTLQFVHNGQFVSISDSNLDMIASCFLTPFLIRILSDL